MKDNKKSIYINGKLADEYTERVGSREQSFSSRIQNIAYRYHAIMSTITIPTLSNENRAKTAQLIATYSDNLNIVETLDALAEAHGWHDLRDYLRQLDTLQRYKLVEELNETIIRMKPWNQPMRKDLT